MVLPIQLPQDMTITAASLMPSNLLLRLVPGSRLTLSNSSPTPTHHSKVREVIWGQIQLGLS